MQIIITKKGSENLDDLARVKWRLFSKQHNRIILLYLIMGSGLLLLNLAIWKKDESFWNWQSSIGIGVILLGLFNLFHMSRNRTNFFRQVSELKNSPEYKNGQTVLNITDLNISYNDPLRTFTAKWDSINGYEELDNYVFFHQDKNRISSIGISKNDLTYEEYSELKDFLQNKYDNSINPY
jgi:hypothetical protein